MIRIIGIRNTKNHVVNRMMDLLEIIPEGQECKVSIKTTNPYYDIDFNLNEGLVDILATENDLRIEKKGGGDNFE